MEQKNDNADIFTMLVKANALESGNLQLADQELVCTSSASFPLC
jgi:hypothetical protein